MPDRIDPLLDTPRPDDADPGSEGASPDGGAAVLPGADRPEWLLPGLVVAFSALIAWLVIFGQTDDGAIVSEPPTAGSVAESADDTEGDDTAGSAATEPAASSPATAADSGGSTAGAGTGEGSAAEPGADDAGTADPDVGVDGAVVDPIGDAEAEAAGTTAPDVDAGLELPPVGTVRVGDEEYALERSCVGLRPFAPADDGDVVSAHVFTPDGDAPQVIERWVTGDGIGGVRVDGPGAAGVRQVAVADGPDGSFTATLERPDGEVVDVALTPLAESERSCDDVVVTNEPGRLAFPHTRAVLSVCTTGDPGVDGRVVAVLTEGTRVVATGNGDGTAELTLRAPETLSSPPLDLTDPSGELFVDGTRLGYSGLPTDGEIDRDLTFDVDVDEARECTDADTGLLG